MMCDDSAARLEVDVSRQYLHVEYSPYTVWYVFVSD